MADPHPTPSRPARSSVVVAVASFVVGAATFFLQGVLPEALSSFANSASGWTLVTVLLLTAVRVRTGLGAVLGAASFVLLTLGYSAAASLRGLTYDPTLFAVVGLLVGPFVGVAATWLRSTVPGRAAPATALLVGIGAGEAVYGLTVVAGTTSPVYWVLLLVVSIGLLALMLARRIRPWGWRVGAVVGAAAVAATFWAAYQALGGV